MYITVIPPCTTQTIVTLYHLDQFSSVVQQPLT
jgi:hypothetical protein